MKVNILGIAVDNVTYSQVLAIVRGFWRDHKKHYVVTPNPEFVIFARRNKDFLNIINNADLVIPDGVGLIWAARILGTLLESSVTVSRIVAQRFKARFPQLKVVGWGEGDATENGDKAILDILPKEQIGLLLIAYGHPKQEFWISRNLSKIDVKVAIGIGGAFDYWSGRVRRAPRFVRKLGMEWLYRLISDPTRFRRQLALPVFAILVLKEKILH